MSTKKYLTPSLGDQGALHKGWVSETVNWAHQEQEGTQGKNSKYGRKPKGAKASLEGLTRQNNDVSRPRRTPPKSPEEAPKQPSPGRRKTNMNKSEYRQCRKELDDLMNLVLSLQDQGRFSEVSQHMKSIQILQEKIERAWEQDHIQRTGVAPKKPPPARRPEPNPVKAAPLDTSPVLVAQPPSVKEPSREPSPKQTEKRKEMKKQEDRIALEMPSPISGSSQYDAVSSSDDDDAETSASSEVFESTASEPSYSFRGSNGGDYLLLINGEEEKEIIRTLRNEAKSAPAGSPGESKHSYDADKKKGVFTTRQNAKSRRKLAERPKKERFFISKEGMMYKAPPENKRFSRWRQRFFSLSGAMLSYAKDRNKITRRFIPLEGAKTEAITLGKASRKKGKFEIRIRVPYLKRVFRLRLRSKREALEWHVAILNNIRIADQGLDKRKKKKAEPEEEAANKWIPKQGRLKAGVDISKREEDEDINKLYEILGLSPKATYSMIKKRYRELARTYHPDKSKSTDTERFAEIARAFETLQDTELRKEYDLCERVKDTFREGIKFRIYHDSEEPLDILMFMDSKFEFLYWQDPDDGSILQDGHKYVSLRYIQEILAGTDGFLCPPGRADQCLTLRGVRLGCTLDSKKHNCDIRLSVDSKAARDDILDGLRIFRCRHSQLFRMRLDEMRSCGMR